MSEVFHPPSPENPDEDPTEKRLKEIATELVAIAEETVSAYKEKNEKIREVRISELVIRKAALIMERDRLKPR